MKYKVLQYYFILDAEWRWLLNYILHQIYISVSYTGLSIEIHKYQTTTVLNIINIPRALMILNYRVRLEETRPQLRYLQITRNKSSEN